MTKKEPAEESPNRGDEAPSLLAFDERARTALTLRMAGYSEPQILKLLARSHGLEIAVDPTRRAA
jgi:hypothetical protein